MKENRKPGRPPKHESGAMQTTIRFRVSDELYKWLCEKGKPHLVARDIIEAAKRRDEEREKGEPK